MGQKSNIKSVIWIVSFPKSGNTWVQSVVRQSGKSHGFPQEDLDVYKLIKQNRKPVAVGGIHPSISNEHAAVLKTHSKYKPGSEVHPRLNLKTIGFVNIRRNPLDMLLSYINFTRLQYKNRTDSSEYKKALFVDLLGFDRSIPYKEWVNTKLEDIPQSNLDHALTRFTELGTGIPWDRATGCTWIEHCFSWFEAGKKLPSVFMKYEDLLNDPECFLQLKRLFTFPDSSIIEAINFVNQWRQSPPDEKESNEITNNEIFYNKMSSYYYPQFFSAGTIKTFLDTYERELNQLGYGDLPISG